MKKLKRYLKDVDIFKKNIGLKVSRWNPETQKNENITKMGSKTGGVFTIMLVVALLSYFIYLTRRMYRGVDDNLLSLLQTNDLDDGDN